MSLINQMLQDLEKRRASAVERGALPNQVRVLPQSAKSNLRWWLIAAGALIVIGVAWQFGAPRFKSPAAVPAADGADNSGKYLDAPASRLALDLARVPPPKPVPPRPAAVADTARVPAPPVAPPAVSTASVVGSEPPAATVKPSGPFPENKSVAPVASALVPPVAGKPRVIEVNADSKVQTALVNSQIDKRMQQMTPVQQAENEYREAATLLNQGRLVEAQDGFRQALQHNPAHAGARQGLFGLLVDAKRGGEAEQVLKDGLKLNPNQPGFAMALARLQLDRGDAPAASETLQASAGSAQNSPDYLAFYAALLQRQSRHREAAEQYQAALRLAPQSGVWLMGLGISLQALDRHAEAQDAFRRAKASNTLNAELQAFVDQRLRQLQ
jgi:MSHA biogenesis protein MshN